MREVMLVIHFLGRVALLTSVVIIVLAVLVFR